MSTELPTLEEWTLPVIEKLREAVPGMTFEAARDLVYAHERAAIERGEVIELPDGTFARADRQGAA